MINYVKFTVKNKVFLMPTIFDLTQPDVITVIIVLIMLS